MTDRAFKTAGIPGKIAYIEKTVNGETVFVPYVELNTAVTLTAGDIEIGAVEIKNATDDTRATVGANGLYTDVRNIQAGTNIIGKVGIDQTTPGTTNKVSIGTDGTVAINTALPAGTNAIGKLAANSGVDIGDVDVTSLPALPAGSNLIGNVGHGKTIKNYSASITSDTDIVAAVASKRIKVIAYSIINQDNTADTVIFKSNGTGGTELWRVYLRGPDANTPFGANLAVPAPSFLFATVAGEKLTADVSSGATLHLSIAYFDDDAT